MNKKINKKGGFTDLFLFMILAFVVVLISVVMVYIGVTVEGQFKDSLGDMGDLHDTVGNNATQVTENTLGVYNSSIGALRWISVLLIVGMMISIFIGSFLVTTKPVFFIPMLFIIIIAIIVSVPIANTYETLMTTPELTGTFATFQGANTLILYLPVWTTILGFAGAIIMFIGLGRRKEQFYGY